jgi:N-acetylmuramoyl-L-alanine amidase
VNYKKLGITLLALGCMGAVVIVAVMSLSHAGDISVASMGLPDGPATGDASGDAGQAAAAHDVTALEGRKILIDPGHGGFDPGAIGESGVHESDINLVVAQYLQADLAALGAEVLMTRSDDDGLGETQNESLAERRRIIEACGSDVVVSIHMNEFKEDPDICGPLVLFMPGSEQGRIFAELVQNDLNTALGAKGSARSESLYVLKSGNQPCILVECGYLSNPQEEQKLQQSDYQQKIAKAICSGVAQYFLQT